MRASRVRVNRARSGCDLLCDDADPVDWSIGDQPFLLIEAEKGVGRWCGTSLNTKSQISAGPVPVVEIHRNDGAAPAASASSACAESLADDVSGARREAGLRKLLREDVQVAFLLTLGATALGLQRQGAENEECRNEECSESESTIHENLLRNLFCFAL